ncbi:alpha/beta fold hydrolase [Angustibacter sp. McL0619]|uniref:alpha/beta fold hydrolase n=1 Tax=Angustibacter sp. McL0619 TaxID=3415676 RepID=UPI003CEC71F2
MDGARTAWLQGRMTIGGRSLFYRRSVGGDPAGVPILHVHGFAISGSYLMPTARLLAGHGTNVVPDLPGYGRSARPARTMSIPDLAGVVLEIVDRLGFERVVLVGNSMGCPIGLEVAYEAPERVQGLVLVSPAGGYQNRPLRRALGQLAVDGVRETPRMMPVAVPDYVRFGPLNALRLFGELTLYPSQERLLAVSVPTLAVLGDRDPLMPSPTRVREVGRLAPDHVTIVRIEGAAHAINFSHAGELAGVISAWLDGREIVDDPDQPGHTRVIQVPRA